MESQAELLVLLGDIPVKEYLNRAAKVEFSTLQEYVDRYGYGNPTEVTINGKTLRVLPLAHPRQIGALGGHSQRWNRLHREWEQNR
jgi:uracil-DNA glycosylase